jgi:hypothetical protein
LTTFLPVTAYIFEDARLEFYLIGRHHHHHHHHYVIFSCVFCYSGVQIR